MQTHATARHHGLPVGVLAVVVACAAAAAVAVEAQKPITFEKREYAARRARLMDRLDGGFAVVLGAQPVENYNEHCQNNDFVYLTGVEIPNAILLVDAASCQSTLFFTTTERAARNDGISLDLVRNPQGATGIEKIAAAEEFSAALARMFAGGAGCTRRLPPRS